jgi:uncharacterized membrane protein YoaK (UPF0700 family)
MITRLPPWVLLYAWILAFMAGIINVVGFMSFEHQAITHLTGTTSMLSAAIANADVSLALHLLCIIGSFFLGAVLSGMIIRDSTLKLGLRYGVALLIESAALVLAVYFLEHQSPLGIYLAGAACGLQNAMASTFSGTVIRTSHVTGMFTDLGIFLGHYMRGVAIERRRLILSVVVISGFFSGGTSGAFGFGVWHFSVLYVPALIAFALALVYGYYRRKNRPIS